MSTVPLQEGITLHGIPTLVPYTFTTDPSHATWEKVLTDLFTALSQASAAAPVLSANNVVVTLASPFNTVTLTDSSGTSDLILSPGIQRNDYLLRIFLALVAVNNSAIDAILTQFQVQIVQNGVQLFPRP